MPNTFIKNHDLLKEDSHVKDLFDFSESIKIFNKKLDSILESSIIGIVGKFGMGKSTMLFNFSKQRKKDKNKEDELWFEFDAWKYPDRKDLWENFILDFSEEIGIRKKTLNKIKGESKIKKIGLSLFNFFFLLPFSLIYKLFLNIVKLIIACFSQKKDNSLFKLQKTLIRILNGKIKKNKNIITKIIMIIEDIDRSGDKGIFFLETLNNFLKNTKLKKTIIVIVPIGDNNFYEKFDSYQKSLDYIEFFTPEVKSFETFIKKVIKDNFLKGNNLSQINSFFEFLLNKRQEITIRTIKLILRKAEVSYIKLKTKNFNSDVRIIIAVEASKFLFTKENKNISLYKWFKFNSAINNINNNDPDSVINSFLYAIYLNKRTIYQSEIDKNLLSNLVKIKIIEHDNSLIFNIDDFYDRNSLNISKKYFYE